MAEVIQALAGNVLTLRAAATLAAGANAAYDVDLTDKIGGEFLADVIPSTADSTSIYLYKSLNGTAWANRPTEVWVVETADIPTFPPGATSVIIPIPIYGPHHYRIHFNNDDGGNATGLISLTFRDYLLEQLTRTYP